MAMDILIFLVFLGIVMVTILRMISTASSRSFQDDAPARYQIEKLHFQLLNQEHDKQEIPKRVESPAVMGYRESAAVNAHRCQRCGERFECDHV